MRRPAIRPKRGYDKPARDHALRRRRRITLVFPGRDTGHTAYRSVFVLRAPAEALGITEATGRTSFFRARRQLREAPSQEIDLTCDDAFAFAGAPCTRIVAVVMSRRAAAGECLH